MTKYTESVKQIAQFLRKYADKSSNPDTQNVLLKHADSLVSVEAELLRLSKLTMALPPELDDIHDLPADLLAEISAVGGDELEDQIVTVLNAYGGEASLDQILVGLYRKFKVIQKRRFLMNKLYRMPMVWSVPKKKGVYTLTEPEEDMTVDEKVKGFDGDEDDFGQDVPF